jgi:hypothetical protein
VGVYTCNTPDPRVSALAADRVFVYPYQ